VSSFAAFDYFLAATIGYLLGSFPSGLIVSRTRGLDIRDHGSGNIGATNVLRVMGKKWGYFVFGLDALKGFAAVRIAGGGPGTYQPRAGDDERLRRAGGRTDRH